MLKLSAPSDHPDTNIRQASYSHQVYIKKAPPVYPGGAFRAYLLTLYFLQLTSYQLALRTLSLEQRHNVLWQRVSLGQHTHTGLLQDLRLGQVGSFSSEVCVLNT